MGPSGSGKSTTMNIIGALDTPTRGQYLFNGFHVEHFTRDQRALLRRQYLGFVFQGFNLLPRTSAIENVELPLLYRGEPAKVRHEMALEALDKVGLTQWKDHTPAELSGGQQQRVAIAGIIAMRPDCIVLDEPTAMLDPAGRREVMKTIRRLNRENGITIILITHYMDEAAQAERVVVMDKGKIILDDTPSEVFSHVDMLREVGLDVPQVTQLMYLMDHSGFEGADTHIINEEECADYLYSLLSANR